MILGVGINDMPDLTTREDPFYMSWKGMLDRCYNKSVKHYENYGGAGVKVCPDWLVRSQFRNYCLENNPLQDYQLDKDILACGEPEYSPEKSRFIPPYLNIALRSFPSGLYLPGASYRPWTKDMKKEYGLPWSARCLVADKNFSRITHHKTEEEAHFAWLSYKIDYFRSIQKQYENDNRVDKDICLSFSRIIQNLEENIINKIVCRSFI